LAKLRGAYRGRKKSLSNLKITRIRQRLAAGEQKATLARKFGISLLLRDRALI
jgi:hypothetical protein